MARTYLTFGDIEGKLEVLRVECSRCQRKGRYSARGVGAKDVCHGRRRHPTRSAALRQCIGKVARGRPACTG